MSLSHVHPTMTDARGNATPFDFTIQSAQPLRALIGERMYQLLGCGQKTRTVRDLKQLDLLLDKMLAHLRLWNVEAALVSLRMLEAQGFTSAARVLIGADPTILDKATFVSRATCEFRALTRALARELDWYEQLAVADSSAVRRLSEAREQLK